MKNKFYVERYADRIVNGDALNAVTELINCFINEYNSEVLRRNIRTHEQQQVLIRDINRKGNELAEMMEARTGVNILKHDWFVITIKLVMTKED